MKRDSVVRLLPQSSHRHNHLDRALWRKEVSLDSERQAAGEANTSMRCGAAARPSTEPVYMPEYTSASDLERS